MSPIFYHRSPADSSRTKQPNQNQTMKNYTAIIAIALTLPAGFALAQQPEGRPPGPPPGGDRQRQPDRGERPHVPPVIAVLADGAALGPQPSHE